MGKIVFFILIGLCCMTTSSKAQFYGSKSYSYMCIQQHETWCAFACLEMYCKGQYKQAGMKSEQVDRDYRIVVDCGRITSGKHGYTECMSDIGLWDFVRYANYILKKKYVAYTDVPALFPFHAPEGFYKFPYFGMNVARKHMVLLIGVKVEFGEGEYIHTIHFVDPNWGAVRHMVSTDYPLDVLLEGFNS